MKKFETIILSIIVIGMIFNYLNIVGSGTILFFTLFLLAIIYLLFPFVIINDIPIKKAFDNESYLDIPALRLVFSIYCGVVFSSYLFGLMYNVFHWENADTLFFTSISLLILCFTVSIIKYIKNREQFYKNLLIRIFILLGLGLISIFLWRI